MTIDLYEFIRKYKVWLILLIEAVALMVYIGVSETDFTQTTLGEEGISLDKGIYTIKIEYQLTGQAVAEVFGSTSHEQCMWKDRVSLDENVNEKTFQVWVNEEVNGVGIDITCQDGELETHQVLIETAWNSHLYLIICFVLKLVCVNAIFFLVLYRDRLQKYSHVICAIAGITFICSIGVFNRYMVLGHDAIFHLNRIEGLKDALISGAFPVRVQPNWLNGWGYGVSLMYGDAILALPAFMRICGFTVQTSYKTFIVAINLLTAITSYYAFSKMCRNNYKALFVTLIYCTGLYRLACIYLRAAVGEYAVMAFLPLVVLGFWYAFEEEITDKDYGKKLIIPVIGFTGMIQTHILTCEMSAFFIVLLCLILVKKVLRKETLTYLIKLVVITILVNLWFIVPFLSMLGEELTISGLAEMRDDFRLWGLSVTELFTTTISRAYGFTFGTNTSLANKCTFTIGLALWGCAAVTGYLLWNKKAVMKKEATIMLALGILAAYMATNLFPYDVIKKYFSGLASVLAKIQFSYRFLGMASLFMALGILFTLIKVNGEKTKRFLALILMGISFIAIYQGMDYQYQILYGGSYSNIYCGSTLDSEYVVSGEYLYKGTQREVTRTERDVIGDGIVIINSNIEGLSAQVECITIREDAYLELPIFYYPGYIAYDYSGERYEIIRSGNNNRIRVELPDKFNGIVYVKYKEPIYWRICEVISLISFICLLFGRQAEMLVRRINNNGRNKKTIINEVGEQ